LRESISGRERNKESEEEEEGQKEKKIVQMISFEE
jgi:hypothetical protein